MKKEILELLKEIEGIHLGIDVCVGFFSNGNVCLCIGNDNELWLDESEDLIYFRINILNLYIFFLEWD